MMKLWIGPMLVLGIALMGTVGPAWAQRSPFSDGITVNLTVDTKKDGFDEKLDRFEKSVARGMEKAGKAVSVLAKDLDRIFREANSSSPTTPPIVIQENPSAQAVSWGSSYRKGEVGSAAKSFWDSLVNLTKKFGDWAKAFWSQLTGPGEDEAPIAHGLNELNTKIKKWSMGRAWDNFTHTGGQLFGAMGRFVKNAFQS